jgi:DNA primase catalytic core
MNNITPHHDVPLAKRDTVRDLDLAELIGFTENDLDELEGGRDIRIPCPAHGGHDDNMSITLGDQGRLLFHCYSAGCSSADIVVAIRSGEVINTQRKAHLHPVPDLLTFLTVPTPEVIEKREEARDQWAESLQNLDKLHPAWQLLAERGITREQAKELGLGYGSRIELDQIGREAGLLELDSQGQLYQIYSQRITVPLVDTDGVLLGFVGRDVTGTNKRKWVNPSKEQYDKSSFLYGENALPEQPKTLVVCEGYWDQIACTRANIAAVAVGGTALTDQQVVRIRLIDPGLVIWVADGDVPGRQNAAKNIAKLAKAGLTVSVITAPDGQDPADWGDDALAEAVASATASAADDLVELAMMGVDLDDGEAKKRTASVVKQILKDWPDKGEVAQVATTQLAHTLGLPVAKLREGLTTKPEKGEKESALVKMIRLASLMYEIHCDHSGEQWITNVGSHVVRPFSAVNNETNNRLLAAYLDDSSTATPSNTAKDALRYLSGRSYDGERVEVAQRIADVEGVKYIDLGRADEQVLIIEAGQTPVVGVAPEGVYFSRRGRYGELPIPEQTQGVTIDTLWNHMRVAVEDRPIVLAWLFAAWSPTLQTPIMLLEGAHGAAKSTTARRLLSLLDPPPSGDSGLRKSPKDDSALVVTLGAARVVAIDNLSYISPEMSDTLCLAATGGEAEGRKLYTDDEVFSVNVRSAVILTGIDLGVLHGDLASRVASIKLDPIPTSEKIADDLLEDRWGKVQAGLVWEIAELMSVIMAVMPTVKLTESPRMASFGRVLKAVDQIMGTDGLSTFMLAESERQKDVALTDPVATEIIRWATNGGWPTSKKWSGTSADLLRQLNAMAAWAPGREPKGWPTSANAIGMKVTKLITPLATEGIEISKGRDSSSRIITISKLDEDSTTPVEDETVTTDEDDEFLF